MQAQSIDLCYSSSMSLPEIFTQQRLSLLVLWFCHLFITAVKAFQDIPLFLSSCGPFPALLY